MSRIDLICRLCLSNSPTLCIFDDNNSISDKIRSFCSFQIDKNDGLPNRICSKCMEMLNLIFEFKLKCEKSDKVLRDNYLEESLMKKEVDILEEVEFDDPTIFYPELKVENCSENDLSDTVDVGLKIELESSENVTNVSVRNEFEEIIESETFDNTKIDFINSCLISGKTIHTKKSTIEYIKTCISQKIFECTVCAKKFKSKKSLKEHEKTHCNTNDFQCPHCEKLFKTRPYVQKHIRKVHEKAVSKCKICDKLISSYNIEIHIKKHTLENSFQCDICEKHFFSKASLISHMRNLHSNKILKCKFCGSEFSSLSSLKDHQISHSQEIPEKRKLCPYCGKSILSKNMKSHVNTHTLEKSFECTICFKKFARKVKLKTHELTHLTTKDFLCPICGKPFKTSGYVRKHIRMTHEASSPVICNVCGKQQFSSSTLKSHMITHTGEKKFKCDICQKSFGAKHTLIGHMRLHTGEKPFTCRFCKSKFASLKTLLQHKMLHTGEKPYSCPSCSKGFVQLSNMKSHFKNNHKGVKFIYKSVFKK